MKPETMNRADFVTSVVLLVFSVALVVESYRMPRLEDQGINPWSAPGVVPGFLGVILLLLAIGLFIRSLARRGYVFDVSSENIRGSLFSPESGRLVLTLVLCIGYAGGLLGRVPYWLATFVFVGLFVAIFEWKPGLSRAQRNRRILVAVILAAATSAVVSLTFEKGFLVTLP